MTTYNTGNPLGSSAPKDLFDNAQNLDFAVNDITQAIWLDRFGRSRKTWHGIEREASDAIAGFGYITLDSFEAGATLTLSNQVLRWQSNGEYYRWDGGFPKVVAANSTPDNSGGIGAGAWLGVGAAVLSSAQDGAGDALVAVKAPYAGAVARTQHDKNAEKITPADFGATGSGADETSYFTALEAAISGQVIDLLGKTYTVSAEPVKNKYINGAFRLTQIIKYNGLDYSYQWNKQREKVSAISPGVSLLRDARTSMARNVFSFSQLTAVQGVCISEVNKQLYTLGLTTDSGGNEVSFVTLFSTASRGTLSATGASAADAILGHQGISLEYLSNGTRLWASVRYNSANYPDAGRQVVRFSYSGTAGDAIANVQLYTLFGAEFNASYKENNCLPAVSYDGRFLVAYGRKTTRDVWIRVFDLKMLIDGGAGDYSDKFIYEFNTNQEILSDDDNSAFTPIQAMACDGAYVYLLAGGSSSSATKKIYAYTIDGVFSGKNDNISLGAVGGSLEPEGIFVYRPDYSAPPCLAVHYINGTSAARVNNIWALGYRNPVVTNYTLRGVGTESPQADWHVSRQSSPATVASVSANAMQIIQNDSGNIFLPHVCSSTDGTIVEFDAGPASDYRNGRLTYTYNATNPYWAVWVNNTSMMYFQNNAGVLSIRPGSDNTTSLGTSANRWSNVYAVTATINTSDERLKLRLDIEDAEKAAALELKASLWKYQFKDANALKEDGGRYHFGIGAQSVGEILTNHGLDPDQYAFYCYDKWDAQYEPVMAVRTVSDPDTGEETEETYDTGETTCVLEAGDRYGVRYEELLCFIMAAL